MQPPDDFDDDDLTEVATKTPAAVAEPEVPDEADLTESDVTEVSPRVPVWTETTSSLRDRVPDVRAPWSPPSRPRSPEFEATAPTRRRGRGPIVFGVAVAFAVALAAFLFWNDRNSDEDVAPEVAVQTVHLEWEQVDAG